MKLPVTKRLRAIEVKGIPPMSGIIPKSSRKGPGPFWARVSNLDRTHRSDLGLRSRSRACPPKLPKDYRRPIVVETAAEKSWSEVLFTSWQQQRYAGLTDALVVWRIDTPLGRKPKELRLFRKEVIDFGVRPKMKPFFRWCYTDPWCDDEELDRTPCKIITRPIETPNYKVQNLSCTKIPPAPARLWEKTI